MLNIDLTRRAAVTNTSKPKTADKLKASPKTKLLQYALSAGYCQFEGCPKRVLGDDVTERVFNTGQVAHNVGASEEGCAIGYRGHLVLVTRDQRDLRAGWNHPRPCLHDLVPLHSDLPSVGRAPHRNAERLGGELMAETDADVRPFAREQLPHKILGGRDPMMLVIDRTPAGGQQPAVALVDRRREPVLVEVVSHQLDRGACDQRSEQLGVVARDLGARGCHMAYDEQSDTGHRNENTDAPGPATAPRCPDSRNRGITPSPNQYASSRWG